MKTQTIARGFKRVLCGLTALAAAALMLPNVTFASEGEITAPVDWATATTNLWGDEITITYTIPEGTDYSKITFPIFNVDENGFGITDEGRTFL